MSVTVSDGTLYTDLNGFVARQPGVRLCTGSGESGRRPRGDGGAPTDDGNGVGEHLNETESLFDSVAKQYITEESQLFRPLTAYRKPVASEELSKQRLEARLSHLYAEEEHATLS
ncbi:hypothetical protein PF001_g21267 [Phytophthora fragariae]|uniref:Uncharacterized protein n=1 Tax=Phytophthora fragariae TaxID=53985 RepID=A0A6A4C811_9STRA|nr:hypothetical protein PF003_g29485 [Phytophthora fragariae]KAE9286818.1 hypothetical protein PF001_g21267 [Phytophthora fragariae]